MNIAKVLVLPLVAVAAVSIFCKAQAGGTKEPSTSAAPSAIANQPPYTVPVGDTPRYSISDYISPSTALINDGIAAIGKEEREPRTVHFEFTLTLPASK